MEYQKRLRRFLCLLWMSAAVCLAGCRASFGGYLPGGKEELVFTCKEAVPEEEREAPEAGTVAGGSGNPESAAAETDAAGEEGIAAGGSESPGSTGVETGAADEAGAAAGGSESPEGTASQAAETPGITADGRVNLNTAGVEELMTLKGIGETRARAIIEYRTQNGPFTKAEDIMQITGIKEGIYTKIQDQIIVR